jgi:hypothetical protein
MGREDFGETTESSEEWSVDQEAKEVIFALTDASGETTFSGMLLSIPQRKSNWADM